MIHDPHADILVRMTALRDLPGGSAWCDYMRQA